MATDQVTVRMRCTQCQVTRLVGVPRQGDVMLLPAGMIHVPCGQQMKVLSKGMRKFLAGGAE